MTPAPTVNPPSRMANFDPFSSAPGGVSSTARVPPFPARPPPRPTRPRAPPQPPPGVAPRLPLVQRLVEHLHPGHHRALALLSQSHDLRRFPGLHHPPAHPPPHQPAP